MPVFFDIACCPRCRSPLSSPAHAEGVAAPLKCTNESCRYFHEGFAISSGQPLLVDFENSIFSKGELVEREGESVLVRHDIDNGLRSTIRRLVSGENKVAEHFCQEMIRRLRLREGRPRVLVIGGGTVGNGAQALYACDDIEIIGTDVYVSSNTHLVADAHQLPFIDGSFDGVWIQAVLEHLLDPHIAAAEIHRVLKPDGLLYADTPFMQQVHEGAYDFTRFTVSGHRWLFRNFTLISAGASAGAGTASYWSLRYFIRALTGRRTLAHAAAIPFFWLRYFDRWAKARPNQDAASGVYFFGTKAETPLGPREMITFYETQAQRPTSGLSKAG